MYWRPLLAWIALSEAKRCRQLPAVAAVLSAGVEMVRSGELLGDVAATAQRVLLGFGLAVLVSVPLGVVMGTFQAGQALFEPVIALLRYLPASAFIPLLIIWLGLGEPSKIALLFVGTVFFNTLMTADVVRTVPRSLIDVSYTLGAHRSEVLRKVVVPHSLPGIIDAIRVNAAAAWNLRRGGRAGQLDGRARLPHCARQRFHLRPDLRGPRRHRRRRRRDRRRDAVAALAGGVGHVTGVLELPERDQGLPRPGPHPARDRRPRPAAVAWGVRLRRRCEWFGSRRCCR
jgi:hypothetical protein